MSKLTKNQKVAEAKVDSHRQYKLTEACALVKEVSYTKFDASVELSVRLGVDPRKANQMVRGVVTLPHGTGKVTRVLVLCTPDKEAEAQAAGADFVGLDDYIEKIKGGKSGRNGLGGNDSSGGRHRISDSQWKKLEILWVIKNKNLFGGEPIARP